MNQPRTWYRIENSESNPNVAEIHIIDFIGDWIDDAINRFWGEQIGITARAFVDQLSNLPATVTALDVHINSPGGDVQGGINIANALRAWASKGGRSVTTYVDGLAASIASVIAMAGTKVVMADNALMMIHNPWGVQAGDAAEMRKMADVLDTMRDQIVATYKWHATVDDQAIVSMMNKETWMTADEAVAGGFATEKLEGLKAAASINPRTAAKLNVPERFRDRVNAWIAPKEAPAPTAPVAATPIEVIAACKEHGCSVEMIEQLTSAGATLEQVRARTAADKTARDQAAQRERDITAVCKLAGVPEFAADYIAGGMPIDRVKAQLAIAKVKLDAAQIDGSLPPDAAADQTQAGWKKAHARVNAGRQPRQHS